MNEHRNGTTGVINSSRHPDYFDIYKHIPSIYLEYLEYKSRTKIL